MQHLTHSEKYQIVKAKRADGNRRDVKPRPEIKSLTLPVPTSSPSFTVEGAVNALMNSSTKTTVEVKGGLFESKISFNAEVLAAMKGMFGSGKVYTFQLHASTPQAASVAGAFLVNFPWSPAVTSYSEYAALAALFDEVKIRSSRLYWSASVGWGLVAATPMQLALAPDNVTINTAPSSFTAVQRLAESVVFNSNIPQLNGGLTIRKTHKIPSREYCSTATPAVASPPAGCVGQWSCASGNTGTNSFIYAYLAMTNTFAFRSRA